MKVQDLFEMTSTDLAVVGNLIQRIFKTIAPIDVSFSNPAYSSHVKERLTGRDSAVTLPEITSAFAKVKEQFGKELFIIPPDQQWTEWVIKDVDNRLNIVFAISLNAKRNKYILKCITIMRKDCDKFMVSKTHQNTTELYV